MISERKITKSESKVSFFQKLENNNPATIHFFLLLNTAGIGSVCFVNLNNTHIFTLATCSGRAMGMFTENSNQINNSVLRVIS